MILYLERWKCSKVGAPSCDWNLTEALEPPITFRLSRCLISWCSSVDQDPDIASSRPSFSFSELLNLV